MENIKNFITDNFSHLRQFYSTDDDFQNHLQSGEVKISIPDMFKMMPHGGVSLIDAERKEQIEKHGRTVQNDIKYNTNYELSNAAALLCYVDEDELNPEYKEITDEKGNIDTVCFFDHVCPSGWDVNLFNKMMRKEYKERLIIARELIAAELDRINNL